VASLTGVEKGQKRPDGRPKIRAIIFDFDGLILETEEPIFRSWQELYRTFGCELTLADWAHTIGIASSNIDPYGDLERRLGRPLDRDSLEAQRLRREMELIGRQPVLPGVREYLEDAGCLGLKVGLASSSSCAWVTGHLARFGLLDYFDSIKAFDDVRRSKPDPEVYLVSLQALQVRPEQAVVFEDSANGILAARRAGIFCVAVPSALTRRLPLGRPDLRLDSLAEIPLAALLQKIEGNSCPRREI